MKPKLSPGEQGVTSNQLPSSDELDQLSPSGFIARYILECRGCGHFLPYEDYAIIEEWLGLTHDQDELLLILADILPNYFATQAGGPPRSLRGVRKLVLTALRERRMREG